MRWAFLLGLVACVPAPEFQGQRDSAVSDVRPDDAADAGTGWSTPIPIAILNSSLAEQCPFVTADGMELYFSVNLTGRMQIMKSQWTGTDWASPTVVPTLSPSMWDVTRPILSHDGLTMYLGGSFSLGKYSVYTSTRPSPTIAWTMPAIVNQLSANNPAWAFPGSLVGADENTMYLAHSSSFNPFRILSATRTGTTWGNLIDVPALDISDAYDQFPWVNRDDTIAILTSSRAANPDGRSLFISTRQSPMDPWPTPVLLDGINEAGAKDFCAMMSEDGHTLYFTSNRGGNDLDLYMSTR